MSSLFFKIGLFSEWKSTSGHADAAAKCSVHVAMNEWVTDWHEREDSPLLICNVAVTVTGWQGNQRVKETPAILTSRHGHPLRFSLNLCVKQKYNEQNVDREECKNHGMAEWTDDDDDDDNDNNDKDDSTNVLPRQINDWDLSLTVTIHAEVVQNKKNTL